jgi:acyl carrier protein
MDVEQSHPDSVSAALTEILRDDLNVDISRVTRESRLVDDVGLDSVAFAVGMVAIEDKLGLESMFAPSIVSAATTSAV